MNNITFELKPRMKRPAVADLQDALQLFLDRGVLLADDVRKRRELYVVLKRERRAQTYGKATRALVILFQKTQRLRPSGVVDKKTAAALNAKLRELIGLDETPTSSPQLPMAGEDPLPEFQHLVRGVVRGSIRRANGQPLGRAIVRLFNKGLRTETKVGQSASNTDGYFEISYSFSVPGKVAPNLLLKAFTTARERTPVAASEVVFNANPELTISLVVGKSEFRSLSEFERLMKEIEPAVQGQRLKLTDLLEDERTQDVSFLSREIGLTPDRVAHIVLSHRHSAKSGLEPEVFYAWFREGLQTEPSALLSQDPAILQRALVQAVTDNIIPQGYETDAQQKAILKSLNSWRVTVALETPADPKQMTLGKLIKSVLPQQSAKQRRFIQVYAEHTGPLQEFWKKLEQDTQLSAQAAKLKLAVVVNNLGQNHLPLVEAVLAIPALKELKDLAGLDEDRWHALITERSVGAPPSIEGADDAEKARRYARALTKAVEEAVPTEFFVARLKASEVGGKADLLKFFASNPAFNIKQSRLESFLQANPNALNGVGNQVATKRQLKGLQRAYRLAPSFRAALGLHQAGKNSAHSISRLGRNAFVRSYAHLFEGPEEAKTAYAKARQVSASAIALIADVHPGMGTSMAAVPDSVAKEAAEIPSWKSLFGSLDFCSCQECQSVYSPGAYLADMLNFLKDRAARPTEQLAVTDVLFVRRPDLVDIELSCENTNTVLPYVDLVLEVLEDAVAPPPSFSPFELAADRSADLDAGRLTPELLAAFAGQLTPQASIRVKRVGQWWVVDDVSFSYSIRTSQSGNPKVESRSRQTNGTQPERAANPQYTNPSAYVILKESVFPWRLPFDYDLEQVRAYLAHLGVSRHQIMETFTPGERPVVLESSTLAHEFLGLSSKEAALITGTSSSTTWQQWGFTEENPDGASWLEKIGNLNEFLRRSGLEYRELLDLLETRYVNAASVASILSTDPEEPETCELDKLSIRGLDADVASRIVRFVRLWRKLSWSMFDLDRAITALGGALSPEFLVELSHLSRLQQRFNLPVACGAAFWSRLDTQHYTSHCGPEKTILPSFYDQLFRNPTVVNPLDLAFSENPDALTGKVVDHAEAIVAALEIGAADLSAILRCGKIFPQNGAITLTLDHLSRLYRHVTLAKTLQLRMPDYLRVIDLIDDAPFTSPKRTVLFAESVNEARNRGFTVAELDYLLRHQTDASNAIAIDERVAVDRLQDVRQELQKSATKEAIARKLAEAFRFEMRTVSLLEPQWVPLMDMALADADKALTRENFPGQFEALIRLHKISLVASRFNLGAEMLEWLLGNGAAQGFLDLTSLPTSQSPADFSKWNRMVNLLALRGVIPKGEVGLLELLEFAHRADAPNQAQVLAKLAELVNWNHADLEYLVGANGFAMNFPDDFKGEKALLKLRDCFGVLQRLGISAEQAKSLSGAEVDNAAARGAKQAVRAKYDDAQWINIARPLRDVLREKQRVALVDYLLAQRPEMGWQDASGLYAHFLIDVEMPPCMMTSRIKQAISSVQLFVQRCLMNLESDVQASSEIDDAWGWWQWMKNYRVWEANRKVFLYPENWIEPELRDDKSPFFKELESELMSSDLTLDTAETAFLHYVEKLDQVAQLEVMGVYNQKDSERDILHVFARTQAPPRVYYHRQRVNSAYWTPWEKVDLDIEGDHLIPVVWNSRLYLFWPMFMEKAEPLTVTIPANGGVFNDQTKKYWEMKLAWSECKQGKWTSKKISSKSAKLRSNTGAPVDLSKVFFIPVAGDNLAIYQRYVTCEAPPDGSEQPGKNDVGPNLHNSYITGSQNLFFFGGCYVDPQITPYGFGDIWSGHDVMNGTIRSNMFFQEEGGSALFLPIRRDVDNSGVALAHTPGLHQIISQGADPPVTRNPFLFQDLSRNYLINPNLSWWDAITVDPSEVGSLSIAKRQTSPFSLPESLHRSLFAVATSSGSASDLAFAAPSNIVLGPDSHQTSSLIRRPNTKYSFHTFYHPYVSALIHTLNREGLDRMLCREVQLEPHRFLPNDASSTSFDFQSTYQPDASLVAQPYPTEEIDFDFSGSYASYNWEVFFHAPLLIADRLTKNQRFEEAAKWFHYIFNPTDTSQGAAPQRYWQTKEFFNKTSAEYQHERLGNLFKLLAGANALRQNPNPTSEEQGDLRRVDNLEAAIKAWRDHPFKPHLVARMRTTAYQKAVVMKYIDNLLAWGDQLFRRDTIESINEATQLYILAAEILGTRPVAIPARLTPQVQTYKSLEGQLDAFGNALVEVEELVPVDPDPSTSSDQQQPPSMLYFSLPKNDKLLRYWDTVADRLFKIRHCQNIEGVVRQLPLFEPPIDPALLVRGAAAGLDMTSLLSDTNPPLPGYRFSVLAQKATELCGELKLLGGTLLATLEKRDAEELALLRAKHETGLLGMIEQVREKQLDDAVEQLKILSASRDVITGRLGHYQRLLGESNPKIPPVGERVQEKVRPRFSEILNLAGVKMFPHETLENALLVAAQTLELAAAGQKSIGAVLYALPDVNMMPMGVGTTKSAIGAAPSASSDGTSKLASATQFGANMAARLGSYVARELDWVLQHNQAAREVMQIDRQIIAAEIRREIARHELQNHRRQMENSLVVEEFMRDKYTNEELYSWMVGQMSGVYFQAYQLAYETAKRTELCYRHELGIRESNFIQFGYWDSLKKGLLAGEKLHHDLKRMEVSYLDRNKREYELTKHISLLQVSPLALISLRTTGKCELNLPEELFDMDGPGHFMRRLKTVAVSIPCVAGPYASINCTLTLQKCSVRTKQDLGADGYARNESATDDRFNDQLGSLQAIVTSSAQSDSGLFETNLRDERYLPFENLGVISSWQLELPANPSVGDPQQFDYDTISDVILHIRYAASEGGAQLRGAAIANLKTKINAAQLAGSMRLFSIRHEFPTEWAKFRGQVPDGNRRFELAINLRAEHYPFWSQGRLESVTRVDVLARSTKFPAPENMDVFDKADKTDTTTRKDTLVKDANLGGLMKGNFTDGATGIGLPTKPVGALKLYFDENTIKDLWLAVTGGN